MEKLVYSKQTILDVHKKAIDKNYTRKNAVEKADRFKDLRRQTRHGLLLRKREIDEKNISPFVTPDANKPKGEAKRLPTIKPVGNAANVAERLKRWKAEKLRRKLEEKKNAKPLFKFCKVPVELGLPKLDNINREIKGKPIKPIYKSIFAPKNHIFQAPKNVKAVTSKTATPSNKENSSSIRKTTRIPVKSSTTDRRTIKQPTRQIQTPKEPVVHKNVWKLKSVKATDSAAKSNNPSETSVKNQQDNICNGSFIKCDNPSDTAQRLSRSSKRKRVHIEEEPILIEDSVIEINSDLLDLTKTPNTDRETIYSDDEISIRTPARKSLTQSIRKSKQRTPYSKMLYISLDNEEETSNRPLERRSLRSSLSSRDSKPVKSFGESTDNCVLREDATENKTLSKKSISFVPELTDDHSPKYNLSNKDLLVASVSKNKRKTRSARLSSKRFSSSASNSAETADYFTKLLENEISRIEGICDTWDNYKMENDLTEDVENMINAAIGLSKLLIAKKFPQFRDLIEECRSLIFKEKPITSQDLQGYWETSYIQVEDLDKKFAHLEKLRRNHWQEIMSERKKVSKKVKGKPKNRMVASKLKDVIRAARNKKREGLDHSLTKVQTGVATPGRLSKSAKKQRLSGIDISSRKSTSRQSLKRSSQPKV